MVLNSDDRPVLRIRRGAAKTFLLTVTDADGAVRDMTGETLAFSAREEIGVSGGFIVTKTMTGVETGADFASGIAALIFTASDFTALTIRQGDWSAFLAWSLTLTTSGGTPYAVELDGRGAALLEVEQQA